MITNRAELIEAELENARTELAGLSGDYGRVGRRSELRTTIARLEQEASALIEDAANAAIDAATPEQRTAYNIYVSDCADAGTSPVGIEAFLART